MNISEAKKILEDILNKLGVNVKRVEVVSGEPHPLLSITTEDSGILIGMGGENLRALNHLVKKVVRSRFSKTSDQIPFLIDVNGYHRKRIANIQQNASVLAERARVFKTDVAMDPLNAYERMIVHATFSKDLNIYTESSGEGRARHIVFKYQKEKNSVSVPDKVLFSEE